MSTNDKKHSKEHNFSGEQLRFIARKAISKYNLALVRGELIRRRDATEYKLLGFEKDKPYFEEDTTKDFSNIPVVQLTKKTEGNYDGIGKQIEKSWNKVKGSFKNNFDFNTDTDTLRKLRKYHSFLLNADDKEGEASKSSDLICPAICYALGEYIENDEITLNSENKKKLLSNLKTLLKKTFEDFPEDENIHQIIGLSSYSIIIIGDETQGTSKYDEIKQQFKGLEGQVDTQFINISTEYSKQWIRDTLMNNANSKNNNIIGLYLLVTNSFLGMSFKVGDDVNRLSEYIIEWSRVNEQIPIAYVNLSTSKSDCKKQLGELGEPVEVQKGSKGTGIINVFAKAIDRYKKKDEEYRLILKDNENLKNESNEIKNNINNLEKKLDSKSKEYDSITEDKKLNDNADKQAKKNKKVIYLFLSAIVFSLFFFFVKSYDPYFVKPHYIIKLENIDEPYYLEIDTTQNFLYVSNNNREKKDNTHTYFYRLHLDDLKKRVRINSQKTSFDFKFIDNVVLFTSNNSGTLEIGKITTDSPDKTDFTTIRTINSNSDSIEYSDAIAISPNKKNIVVTNWTSNDILIITDFNSENPSKFNNRILPINRLRSSGATFVNDSICIISLHENVSQKLLAVDINRDTVYEIKWGTVNHHALDDVKFTGKHIVTCSKKEIYRLKTDDLMKEIYGQNKSGAKPDYNGRIKHNGSTTHISLSTNKIGNKYAVLSHESHNYATIVDVDGSFGTKDIKFLKGDDPIDCSGITVDWRDMSAPVAFIPNSHEKGSKKIYCIKLPDPRKLKYDTPKNKTSK